MWIKVEYVENKSKLLVVNSVYMLVVESGIFEIKVIKCCHYAGRFKELQMFVILLGFYSKKSKCSMIQKVSSENSFTINNVNGFVILIKLERDSE